MAWRTAEIDQRTEEILVDAYNESEQLSSFECVLDEILDAPVRCSVLGRPAALLGVEDAGRGFSLRATVEVDGTKHQIDLLDVVLGHDTSRDLRLAVACYERWARNL
jgi:hypothetical protein